MIAGALEIQMMADLSRLARDMNGASNIVDRGAQAMRGAAGLAMGALAGLAAGLSVGAFTGWIRGAIDAADEAGKMAAKLGIATEELAGVELAFKLAGIESGAMESSLVKLSKNVVDNADLFKRLGVSVRDADGAIRPTTQVLGDVADVFARMPPGIEKTALATEVFGKAGADLIPLLNGGSAGLAAMAEQADALGLSISGETASAAEQFNDTLSLIGMAGQGVARQVAGELLPSLTNMATGFLENMAQGRLLQSVAQGIAFVLKVLYSVVMAVGEAFSVTGKLMGAWAGAAVRAIQGDFKGAYNVLAEADLDMREGMRATGSAIAKAWDTTSDATVKGAAEVVKAGRSTLPVSDAEQKAMAKQVSEIKKLREGYDELIEASAAKIAQDRYELEGGRKLTASEQDYIKVLKDVQAGKETMVALINSGRLARLQANIVEEAALGIQREEARWLEETAKANQEAATARGKETDALRDQVAKQRESIDAMRLSGQALGDREAAMLRDAAAAKDRAAIEADLVDWTGKASAEYREQARLLRERADLVEEGVVVREAKAAADEWAKVTDEIGQGLTDSLYRAFESGKGFFSTLWDGIKNTLKTTVLRVLMQPVQAGMASLLGGFAGGAQAGGGAGGGIGGMAGGLGDLWGKLSPWLTDFGGSVETAVTSLANTFGGADLQGWLAQNSGTLAQYAQFAGDAVGYLGAFKSAMDGQYGAALGSAVGTYFGGPIGAAIGNALGSAIDKFARGGAGTPHMGSVVRVGASGSATLMGDDSQITRNFTQSADDALRVVGGASVAALNAVSSAFGGGSDFEAVLKFASDGQDPSIGDLGITRNGQSLVNWGQQTGDFKKYVSNAEEAFKAYSADVATATLAALQSVNLPQWARDQIASLGDSATIEQVAQLSAGIAQTQRALEGMRTALEPLGGVFSHVAALSGDALYELTAFAGGVEAFAAKTASFVQNYFSEEEQSALQARQILEQLQAVGLNAADLGSRGDLRALADTVNVGTEAGRQQLAAILNIAQQFAGLGDYLEREQTTLAALAAVQVGNVSLLAAAEAARAAEEARLAAEEAAAGGAAAAATSTTTTAAIEQADGQAQTSSEITTLLGQNVEHGSATVDQLMRLGEGLAAVGEQITQAVQSVGDVDLVAMQDGFLQLRDQLASLNAQVARLVENADDMAAAR